MTAKIESDRSLAEAIPYASSAPRLSGESSPRDQDSHSEDSPHNSPLRAFYIPAGSISSQEDDSLSDTERSSRPLFGLRAEDLESTGGFQPTSDNVIVFEVYTPPSQDLPSQRHTSKKFLFSEDVCFQISEEKDSQRGEERPRSSVDALAQLTYSEDDDEEWRVSLPSAGRLERTLDKEVARLQEMYRNATCENDHLRNELAAKEARIQSLEGCIKSKPETHSKQTMTSFEDLGEMQKLKRENEQLTNTCARYEQQNYDLRQEVQICTRDLTNTDKTKGKLTKELKRLSQLVNTYEGEMVRIAGLIAKVLSPETEESWDDRDPRHVSNYLASKVEIISSRHSRLQAIHENTLEECSKLRQELQACKAAMKVQEIQSEEAIRQINARLKTKESIIQKLEGKWQDKEDQFSQKRPQNQTENFTSLLRGLAENSTPTRKSTQGAFKASAEPSDLEDITEKPCAESDEELYASKDQSDSHSELNKTETPVQVKRLAWKAKQDRRKPPHVRTLSYMQNLLATEARAPVLTYKEALKDLREISNRASRAIEESSLTRQQVRGQEGKSSSADKRRKPKEIDVTLREGLRIGEESKARKYKSPYVASLLQW